MSVYLTSAPPCLLSKGAVCFHPRRPGGGRPLRRDGGFGVSPAQVRGRAADPGTCREDTSGQTVQGRHTIQKHFTIFILF